jgi:glutathione S-transferase
MGYLADKTPGHRLYPTDGRARADINKWMFWSANHWGPAISILNWERAVKKFLGRGEPDPTLVGYGEGLFHTFAKVLESHLAKRSWLSGPALSLADVAIACPLMVAEPASLPLSPYANIEAWFSRVKELDAWKKTAT